MAGFELLTSGVGSNNSTNWVTTTAHCLTPPSLSLPLSLYLSITISIYPSITISVCLSIYLFIYLSLFQSVNVSINTLSIYHYLCLSIYLSIYVSLFLSVNLSINTLSPQTQEPGTVLFLFTFLPSKSARWATEAISNLPSGGFASKKNVLLRYWATYLP